MPVDVEGQDGKLKYFDMRTHLEFGMFLLRRKKGYTIPVPNFYQTR